MTLTGSDIRSWYNTLAGHAFSTHAHLALIQGINTSSGTGAWTVTTALRLHVATPVIASALHMRYRSTQADTNTGKVVADLRNQFGGTAVHPTTQRHTADLCVMVLEQSNVLELGRLRYLPLLLTIAKTDQVKAVYCVSD